MDKTDNCTNASCYDVATAFANLRDLTKQVVRGEISLHRFGVLSGHVMRQHEWATTQRKESARVAVQAESGGSGAGRHYKRDENPLHKPSCGCNWCSQEPIGPYRGNLGEDTSVSENKAEE